MATNTVLHDELMGVLNTKGISWFGYKGRKGSKQATFYSYDSLMKDVVNKQFDSPKHKIIISQYEHKGSVEKGKYNVSFQPITK
jgi:hypothetical protein